MTWQWLSPKTGKSHYWVVSSCGGGRFRSEHALWGLRLPTRKIPSPKFHIWMNKSGLSGLGMVLGLKCSRGGARVFSSSLAEVFSRRYSGFLLGPGWSGLLVRWAAVPLRMILMKWDTCRDPNEDQNMTTTDAPSVSSFSESLREEREQTNSKILFEFSLKMGIIFYFGFGQHKGRSPHKSLRLADIKDVWFHWSSKFASHDVADRGKIEIIGNLMPISAMTGSLWGMKSFSRASTSPRIYIGI